MIANHFAAAECTNKNWMRGKSKDIGPSGSHSHPWSNPRLPALNRKIAPEDNCLQSYRPAQSLRRTAERHREAGLNCSATGGAPMGPNTLVLGRNEGLRALQRSSECLQHSFCTLEGHKAWSFLATAPMALHTRLHARSTRAGPALKLLPLAASNPTPDCCDSLPGSLPGPGSTQAEFTTTGRW